MIRSLPDEHARHVTLQFRPHPHQIPAVSKVQPVGQLIPLRLAAKRPCDDIVHFSLGLHHSIEELGLSFFASGGCFLCCRALIRLAISRLCSLSKRLSFSIDLLLPLVLQLLVLLSKLSLSDSCLHELLLLLSDRGLRVPRLDHML